MPLSFSPRLINDPFEDPGLFVTFPFERRALLFDLGDLSDLPPKELLKISHIFISHTHMDHMIGFDRLLRLCLGRDKDLYLIGPPGLMKNVEGKLAGYTWNLVENYANRFAIHVSEWDSEDLVYQCYPCQSGFSPATDPTRRRCGVTVHNEPAFRVDAVPLDHQIPSLGFSMQERFHINVMKSAIEALGLPMGPWLKDFKQALLEGDDPNRSITVPDGTTGMADRSFTLGRLADRIVRITPGKKVTYIADAVYSRSNGEKMVDLARDSDHLFIESAFLEEDRDLAAEKHHLTAAQAGRIAGEAGVKRYTLFHFSPRYQGQGERFEQEARAAYLKYRS